MLNWHPVIRYAIVAALGATLGVLGLIFSGDVSGSDDSSQPASQVGGPVGAGIAGASLGNDASARLGDVAELYDAVRSSVVEIDTATRTGRRSSQQTTGLGSGVVLDSSGRILTNYHVVEGAQTLTVTFVDGTSADASVVATDAPDDLAIVRVEANADELHPATLGDSDALRIGNFVVAVGNPFGLSGSVSTGVLSGTDRTLTGGRNVPDQQGLLQTDAAVNEGSSGGGLFDSSGRLIGVTSAIENPDASTFAGIAYAVPINTAKGLIQRAAGQ